MKPSITSEFTPLKQVIVHTPGQEHNQIIPWEGDHALMGHYPRVFAELQRDHADLTQFIAQEIGDEGILQVRTLLEEIFANDDYRFRFNVIRDILHDQAETYIDHLQARGIKLQKYAASELVKDLIEGYPRKLVLNNHRLPNVIIPPRRELMWVRDSAAVIPQGVIINSMASPRRRSEPALLRAVFKYHPHFDPDSIFLDLVEYRRKIKDDNTWSGLQEHLYLEGGNIMVLSEEVIAIGVGRFENLYANRTTRAAFNLLIKRIFDLDKKNTLRRIYLVNIPDLRGFIHLDTTFNMVGPKAAIVMPYVFGYPDPGLGDTPRDVLQNFVRWLRQNMEQNRTDLSRIPAKSMFDFAGRVEVYDRDDIKKKKRIERMEQAAPYFLDQLVRDGLIDLNNITWIGGPMENYISPYEHLKVALFEQHNMAGNIFTVSPFRTIAYHRNPLTSNAMWATMRKSSSDAHVQMMSSNEMRTDNGGPHCLTLPILREA